MSTKTYTTPVAPTAPRDQSDKNSNVQESTDHGVPADSKAAPKEGQWVPVDIKKQDDYLGTEKIDTSKVNNAEPQKSETDMEPEEKARREAAEKESKLNPYTLEPMTDQKTKE